MVLGPARLGPRFGLTSVLLLRERRPDFGRAADDEALVRAGEVSLEDKGEFVVEGEADTFSERRPLRAGGCRIGPGTGLAAAGTEGLFDGRG